MRLRSAEEVLAHPWFEDMDMVKLENKEIKNPWTEEAFNQKLEYKNNQVSFSGRSGSYFKFKTGKKVRETVL